MEHSKTGLETLSTLLVHLSIQYTLRTYTVHVRLRGEKTLRRFMPTFKVDSPYFV